MKTSSAIAALAIMLSVILTVIIAPAATPLVAAPPAVVTPGTEVPTPTTIPTPTATLEPIPEPGEPVVNVAVDQQVSPPEVFVGDLVRLYVRVFNPGDHPGNDLVVTIPVPSGLILINVDVSRGDVTILEGGRLVRVELGTLLPGLTEEITLVTRAVTAGVIEGNVRLTSSNPTDLLVDNVDRVTLLVRTVPPTISPSPTATEAVAASLAPTNPPQPAPTPIVALRLPNTGAPDRSDVLGLVALAILLIVVGAVVRTRMVKQ